MNPIMYLISEVDLGRVFPHFESKIIKDLGFFLKEPQERLEFNLDSRIVGVSKDGVVFYQGPKHHGQNSHDLHQILKEDARTYVANQNGTAISAMQSLDDLKIDYSGNVNDSLKRILQSCEVLSRAILGQQTNPAEFQSATGATTNGASYSFKLDDLVARAPRINSSEFMMYVMLTNKGDTRKTAISSTEVFAVTSDRYVVYAVDVQGHNNIPLYMAPSDEFLKEVGLYRNRWQGVIDAKEGPEPFSVRENIPGSAVKTAREIVRKFDENISRVNELLKNLNPAN